MLKGDRWGTPFGQRMVFEVVVGDFQCSCQGGDGQSECVGGHGSAAFGFRQVCAGCVVGNSRCQRVGDDGNVAPSSQRADIRVC